MYLSQRKIFALAKDTGIEGTPIHAKVRVNNGSMHITLRVIDRLVHTHIICLPVARISEILEEDVP